MSFAVAKDAVQTTVASYTLGSGSLTVASGQGGQFPTPSPSAPILLTVATAGNYGTFPETFATYLATGIAGDTLSGLTLVDGTDTAWSVGDIVEMRTCAKHINDLAAAVTAAGTVSTVSVASANGFAGSVANPGTTPAITLSTTASGVLKGSAGAISAATAGTDYVIPSVTSLPSLASFATSKFGLDTTNNCPLFTAQADPTTPAAGDLFYSSTSGGLAFARNATDVQRLGGKIFSCGAGTANTGATAVSIFTGTTPHFGSRTIKANTFQPGDELTLAITAKAVSAATLTTLSLVVSLGGTTIMSGTSAAPAGANTMECFLYFCRLKCLGIGSSGSFIGSGQFLASGPAGSMFSTVLSIATPGTPITINTTIDQIFDFTGQFGGANQSLTLNDATLYLF